MTMLCDRLHAYTYFNLLFWAFFLRTAPRRLRLGAIFSSMSLASPRSSPLLIPMIGPINKMPAGIAIDMIRGSGLKPVPISIPSEVEVAL